MSDLIRREDALKAVDVWESDWIAIDSAIRALPAVQPDAREAALREAADLARNRHKEWTNFSEVECDFTACQDIADAILALIDKPAAHLVTGPKCECGMTGPCMWPECKSPILAATKGGADNG